jgi:zinc transport system substrate-binding protein
MNHPFFCFFAVLFLFAGCRTSLGDVERSVAVSIQPIRYFVDRVSGGDFEVSVLVPPGASPETYEPTPLRMKEITRAQAYFHTGLIDFEQALIRGIEENAPQVQSIDLSEDLSLIEGLHDQPNHHGIDPHIWLSPVRVKAMVTRIEDTLAGLLPDSAGKYHRNAEVFISSIDSLDQLNRLLFQGINDRFILIYHPFLTYYASDYELEQIAIEQEGKEPSAGQFLELIRQTEAQKLRTVFFQQELHAPTTIRAFAEENGLEAQSLDPLAYDWLKNMDEITRKVTRALE